MLASSRTQLKWVIQYEILVVCVEIFDNILQPTDNSKQVQSYLLIVSILPFSMQIWLTLA